MAAVPMRERIVEVEADMGEGRSPRYRYGSGLLIGDRQVLTAAHVVSGAVAVSVRGPDKVRLMADQDTALVGDPNRLDLALIAVPEAEALPGLEVAIVNRNVTSGAVIVQCSAVGYPEFAEVSRQATGRSLRETASVNGFISPLSGLVEGLLSLQVTGTPRPLPSGFLDRSEWSGMSGAAVFAGRHLVGVVTEHAPRRGSSDITVTPLDFLLKPATAPADASSWLSRLGISDVSNIPCAGAVERDAYDITGLPYADPQLAPVLPLRRERFSSLLGRHELFGGRHELLATLDALAAGPGGDYLFVTGKSGYGKTAMLANWVTRRRHASATSCYSFVSRVDGTQDEEFTLANLCEQLLLVHRRRAPREPPHDWRSFYVDLLRTSPPPGAHSVVLIDALDEADGWIGPDLFPPLASGVSVIVSAREMADHDWPSELGLPPGTATLALDRLTATEMHDLLERTGERARWVLGDEEALAAMLDISVGDPYYARLLVDDVREGRAASVAELRARPRGLAAYFNRWWADIAASRGEPAVREVLGYLLVARGRLTRRELVDIDSSDALDDWSVDQAMAGIERHVVGDATDGYVIGHDRFRDYLVTDRIGTAARDQALVRLLAHCRRWRENQSVYALNYLPVHLREQGLSEELATLVASPEWLGAHLAMDPSGVGFLESVRTAWRDAETAAAAAGGAGPAVGRELACALAVVSVRSVLVGLPAELLRQLLVRKRWSEAAVIAALREIPKPQTAAAVLAHVAPELSPQGARDALAVASSLPDHHVEARSTYAPRAVALAALAPRLEGLAQREAIAAVFTSLGRTDKWNWRSALRLTPSFVALLGTEHLCEALTVAARGDEGELVASLVTRLHELAGDSEALDAIRRMDDSDVQVSALAAVAPLLETSGLRQAMTLAAELPAGPPDGNSPRAGALRALSVVLDPALAVEALDALAPVRAAGPRVCAAVLLSARLESPERDEQLGRVLAEARRLDDARFRTVALWDALSLLDDASPELIGEAFDAALAASRDDALAAFAPALDATEARRIAALVEGDTKSVPPSVAVTVLEQLPPEDRAVVARRLVTVAQAYAGESPNDRPSALIAGLTVLLPADEAERVLADELARVGEGAAGTNALTEIARMAPDTLWPALLKAVASLEPDLQARIINGLLEVAPASRHDEVLVRALDAARAVPARDYWGESARGSALIDLMAFVGDDQGGALVDEALSASQTIDDAALLVHVECVLVDDGDDDLAPALLDRLAALPPSRARAAVLVAAAGSRHASVRDRAIQITASVDDHDARVADLVEVAHALSADDVATVFEPFAAAAAAAGDDALAAIAQRAPTFLLGIVLAAVEPRPPSHALAVLATTLVRRLQGPEQERAFRWALTFPGERRAEGTYPALLAWILQNVGDALPPELALDAVDAAQRMEDPVSVFPTMAAVATSLSADLRPRLIARMTEVIGIQPVAGARIALAQPLLRATESGPERDDLVRTVVDALPADDPARAAIELARVAPYAEGELARVALDRARTLQHPHARALASASLLNRVGDGERQALLEDVLEEVRGFDDEVLRCECLARLAAAAPPDCRKGLVEEALEAAWEQGDAGVRLVREVLAIAPLDACSSAEIVERALRRALSVGTPEDQRTLRADAYSEQLPGLVGGWQDLLPSTPTMRILDASLVAIVDGNFIIDVFRRRAEQLPLPAMVAVMEVALRSLRRGRLDAWAGAVAELLPHLPVSAGALEQVVQALGSTIDQAVTLEALAPPLPTALRPQSSDVRDQKEESRFVRALGILAPRLASIDHGPLHEVWRELLAAVSGQPRPAMLVDIRQAAPIVASLGAAVGVRAALEGLERTHSSWP